jgi:hypothetical protein
MAARQVEIVATNTVVDSYEARSYPDSQVDNKGFYNLYKVPVYKILVTGSDGNNKKTSYEFMAPRFMPYFNDPKQPDPHYGAKGWLNAGLSKPRTVAIMQYKQDYAVQNRFSPGRGAIVVHGAFYIHAGPASLLDVGFGSAGCIEIIGDYNVFKQSIAKLSGSALADSDAAIQELVNAGKLIVIIELAKVPDIRKAFTRKIHD